MAILWSLCSAALAIYIYRRITKKAQANFRAQVLASFTGVWPVFPVSPWDDTVDDRAKEIAKGFVDEGNAFPKYVQPYYYNDLVSVDGKKISTASQDWQNCLVLFCQDYLRRVEAFHARHAEKDPVAAAQHFSYQRTNLNTL